MGKFSVGQTLVGRGVNERTKGKVQKFRVVKVGTKYIQVQGGNSPFPKVLDKNTLASKDGNAEWEFFISEKALEEHRAKKSLEELADSASKSLELVKEIRRIVNDTSFHGLSLSELQEIRDFLERKVAHAKR